MATSQPKAPPNGPILFLPGLLNDGRLFGAQMAALTAAGHDCRALPLTFADTVGALAQGVLAKAPERFSLIALSMGGYVAFEIARQLQAKGELHRLAALVLLNTSARPDTDETRATREGLIKLAQLGRFKGVTPRLLPRLLGPDALANEAITGLIMQMAEETGRDTFVRQQTAILSRPDSRPFLPSLTMPALVVGGAQDQLCPPDVARESAALLPNAQLHLLDNCGHLSPLEQAAAVTRLLVEFFIAS